MPDCRAVSAEPTTAPPDDEIGRLQARIAELEAELTDQGRRTARLVAEAQEQLYWLERWHVDLNRLMAKPGAVPALDALKRVRTVVRAAKRSKRRLLSS